MVFKSIRIGFFLVSLGVSLWIQRFDLPNGQKETEIEQPATFRFSAEKVLPFSAYIFYYFLYRL